MSTEPTPSNINPPIPQYNPKPQTDQSHPIPELLIDSNIWTPSHDKHLQYRFKERAKELYNQAVENQMKPQDPKEIKKPKVKDTKGLGHTIPI